MISFKNSFLVALLGLAVFIVNCQGDGLGLGLPFMHGDNKLDFEKCLVETGLTKADLQAMHDNPPKEFTTQVLCLTQCLAKSFGFLQDDGTVNSELVKKALPPGLDAAVVSKMIKCLEDAGKVSTCDDLSKLLNCIPSKTFI